MLVIKYMCLNDNELGKPKFKWRVYPDRIEFENFSNCPFIPK